MLYFLTDTITKIKRLKARAGLRSVLSATGTAEVCSIQRNAVDANQQSEGIIGEEYSVFVDSASPIEKADHIVIKSVLYTVRGVDTVNPDWASEDYKELNVVKKGRA